MDSELKTVRGTYQLPYFVPCKMVAGALRRVIFRVIFGAVSCDFTQFQRHTRSYSCFWDVTKKGVSARFISRYAASFLAKNAYFDTMHPLLFRRVHFLFR